MVEIKIACQCGVPFRYGLELVEGRAPEGVGCPTCNAPIAPACNALLDHLTGKLPSPDPSGTRVLKDIKVTCGCGSRYKFELELAEDTMPAPVVCPACQTELTGLANQELSRFAARFADILPLTKAAAPAVPTVTPAPAPPTSEPPAVTTAPPPVTAPETPPAQPVAAPVAVLPVLPVPQSPATAPVTPPPASESPVETAVPVPASAPETAPAKAVAPPVAVLPVLPVPQSPATAPVTPPPASEPPAATTAPETPPAKPVATPVAVLPVLPVPQRPAIPPATPPPASEPPSATPALPLASAPETPPAQPVSAPTVVADSPAPPSAPQAPAPAAPLGAPAVAVAGVIPEYGPLFPTTESPKPPRKGMPNLKPLEVPRMERPARPAGSAPPAAKPAAAAASAVPGQPKPDTSPTAKADAKPAPAKPVAKPVVKVQVVREVNVPLGSAGAFAGALVGAGLWFAVLQFVPAAGAYMALLVGVLAGLGARLLGRGTSQVLGAVASVMSVVFIGVMSWITIGHHINQVAQPFLKNRYEFMMDEAKQAIAAKSDVDLKRIVARSVPTADPGMIMVSDQDMKNFKEQRMPLLQDLAAGKISKAQFESRELAKYRSNYPLDEAWQAAIGVVGLLCALAGIIAGAKIAFTKPS